MKNFSFKRMTSWLLAFLMFAGVMPANAAASGFEDFLNDVIGYGKLLAAGTDDEMAARGAAMAAAAGYSLVSDTADTTDSDTSEAETASDTADAVKIDSTLKASLAEAKTYTDGITINNTSNDPATVVKNFKTHFTWDNEKREGEKSYLFDWSYYNGVVFEGIEYLYEVTGEKAYKDYVVEYMSSLINSNGTWATCTNNSSKQCAGYNSTHGADCYKTASLLLDAYEMTGDSRYLTVAATLYADLDNAAKNYSLSNAGNNYRHTWADDPSPDLWLDGLYMILPFRAEYAKHIGDTDELDLIVDRMQWVSDNMYNSSKGLFYHGADSATSNSGTHWLRSIGWYAAAMADVMDSMEGENLEAMKTQLKKLVDGMKACQNASNGMWPNNMAVSQSSSNPYETSGTALVCYAVMKAVNNGWLDESYADMAIRAFNGICNDKLNGNTLKDICFKGVPKGANSTYYDNEGKGVGPFIMFYAEVLEYVQNAERVTVTYFDEDLPLTIQASAAGLTAITAENVTGDVDLDAYCLDYIMYDIALEGYTAGDKVLYSIRYLDDMDPTNPVVYHIENGVPVALDFELVTDDQGDKYLEFTANSDGIFAYGALKVPEGYTLSRIEITDVYNDQYLAGDSVALSDIRVIAVYTKTGAEDFIRVLYNEHDVANLEELQMSVPGTKTVTIVFENCTDTYEINVHQKHFADENAVGTAAEVVVEIPAIGILTSLAVTEVEDTAAIEKTLTGVLEGDIVAFDITAEGFVNGENTVSVTVPIPDGMDAAKFAVFHVDGSSYTRMPGSANEDGTKYTFTTDHFSLYVGGEAVANYDEYPDATEYPVYPAAGAVRVNKTASQQYLQETGVVKVELDVAGVSVKKAVDVILVADISNSMAWVAGESTKTPPGAGETSKWQDLQAAAGSFINVLLAKNEDGTDTANTVSFVTFGGYDADRNKNSSTSGYSGYFDAVQTVFTSYSDATAAINQINRFDIYCTGADSGYTVTIDGSKKTPQGGTNYDYAFLETASAIKTIKDKYEIANNGASYDESGRQIYVVFMTDGAPDHYNQLYYKTRKNNQFDYYAWYKNNTDSLPSEYFALDDKSTPTGYKYNQYQKPNGYYIPESNMDQTAWTNWIQSDSLYAAEYVRKMTAVNSITAIGFDLSNGSFGNYNPFGEEVLIDVLSNLAGENSCEVFTTDNSAALNEFYSALATKIRYAGVGASTTDIIDSRFTLHLTPITDINGTAIEGANNTIDVILYDLYTEEDADDIHQIGTRTGTSKVVETITFSADGTQAYSSVIGSGINILTGSTSGDYTIAAKNFTYTKVGAVETFTWNIGSITDKEIALSYYAYLKGTMTGDRPQGVYYTNKEAYLDYIDVNNMHAHKVFPMPAVAWGGAVTAYEFYLVNDDGQPCDRNGNILPFANRITILGPYHESLNLNEDEEYEATVIAASVLPAGYTLHDTGAEYDVLTASGTNENAGIHVRGSKNVAGSPSGYSTRVVSENAPYYTQTHVAFGVVYNSIPEVVTYQMTPDTIVIDYGVPVAITGVNANNAGIPSGFSGTVVGIAPYVSDIDLKTWYRNDPREADDTVNGRFGTFTYNESTVTYTLTSTRIDSVDRVFAVIKIVEKDNANNNVFYMYDQINVIPATTIYYEETFVRFTNATGATDGFGNWTELTAEGTYGTLQHEDRPGHGNVYGYDGINSNSKTYSLGKVKAVTVNENFKNVANAAKAEFTFTGTGFDIISLTNSDSGLLLVTVTNASGAVVAKHFIDNYYGFEYKSNNDGVMEWVPVTTTEGQYPYQVPVIKKNLTYGTYTVTLQVAYSGAFEHNDNKEYSFVLDSIRIYDPAGVDPSDGTIKDAYIADGEYKPAYVVIRDYIIDPAALTKDEKLNGSVFIDGIINTSVPAEYKNPGPNNETYLAKYQSITFKIVSDYLPDRVQIGAKLAYGSVDGNGEAVGANLMLGVGTSSVTKLMELKTATDMYYDLTGKFEFTKNAATNKYESPALTFANTGVSGTVDTSAVISLTNVKVTQAYYATVTDELASDGTYALTAETAAAAEATVSADPNVVTLMVDAESVAAAKAIAELLMAEPGFEPEYMDYMIKLKKSGKKTTEYVLVITSDDVDALTINGEDVERVRKASNVTSVFGPNKKIEATLGIDLDADDYIMWLYAVNEDQDYEIIAYSADGEASSVLSTGETYSTVSLGDYNSASKDVYKVMKELSKKNFKPEKLEAKINKMINGSKQLVVEVSEDVEYIIVNGEIIRNYITETFVDLSKDGAETEKRIFITDLNDEDTAEVTAYNEEGVASSSETAAE